MRRLLVLLLGLGALAGSALGGRAFARPSAPAPAAPSPAPPSSAPLLTPGPCGLAWRVAAGLDPGRNENWLNGVAAVGPNDVWAVGYYSNWAPDNMGRTLTEHWDGTAWTLVPSPNPTLSGGTLSGVAALAASDVWVVGNSGGETLTEHWDGTAWSIIPSPSIANRSSFLTRIAAVGPNDIWAVGYSADYSLPDYQTLVEHWDGTAWSIVASPSIPSPNIGLYGVAAVGPNDVWAVGFYETSTTVQTLVEHWNGTAWSTVPSPNVGNISILMGVAAVGPNDVWTVGGSGYPVLTTLVEHWDGMAWSVVPSPNRGDRENGFYDVAVAGANDIWAVGYFYDSGSTAEQTLVEHWNGGAWNVVASPNVSADRHDLFAVTVGGPGNIWAVGYYDHPSSYQYLTLAEHYSDPCPLSTPCPITFADVDATNPFYPYIRCLACRGIVSGYADGTFRPGNTVTRGQVAKMIANAAGLSNPIPSGQQNFADVSYGDPAWLFVERLAGAGYISGYACGGPGEPCQPPDNLPYFRPAASITRSQLTKIDANAAGYDAPIPSDRQTFADVPAGSPFWVFVERAAPYGVIAGYTCGGPGEPCMPPANRPYFRPGGTATRGQTSKIVANTFYPACQTPQR